MERDNFIKLNRYGPIISNASKGDEIFKSVITHNPSNNQVTIDFDGIKTITFDCARRIFGKLFKRLGSRTYYNNINIINDSDDILIIINAALNSVVNKKALGLAHIFNKLRKR